jgi:hypothetical protein
MVLHCFIEGKIPILLTTTESNLCHGDFFISFPLHSTPPGEEQSTPSHNEVRAERGCLPKLRLCGNSSVKAFLQGHFDHILKAGLSVKEASSAQPHLRQIISTITILLSHIRTSIRTHYEGFLSLYSSTVGLLEFKSYSEGKLHRDIPHRKNDDDDN